MLKSKSALLGLGLLFLSGCAPTVQPEAVSVDWSQLQPPTATVVQTYVPATTGGVAPSTYTVPAVTVPTVNPNSLAGTWQSIASAELVRGRADEDAEIAQPLLATRAQQVAAIDGKVQTLISTQQIERNKLLDEFYAALKIHGDDVGWKRVNLDWMVGFPDPDPNSTRKPRSTDIFGRRIQQQAIDLRSEIKTSDALFDATWKSRVALQDQAFQDQVNQHRVDLMRKADTDLATEKARLLALALKDEVAPARRANAVLAANPPSQGPVTGHANGVNVQVPAALLTIADKQTPAWVLQHRLEVYMGTHNLRLAQPGEKGRNITSEFSKWLRQYEPGQ